MSETTDISTRVAAIVHRELATQLDLTPEAVAESDQDLEDLGLDSHGLMTVLLSVERAFDLQESLDVPDEGLESPAALVDAISRLISDS